MVAQDGTHSNSSLPLVSPLVVSVEAPLLVSEAPLTAVLSGFELATLVSVDAAVVGELLAPVLALVAGAVVAGELDGFPLVLAVALVLEVPLVCVGLMASDELSEMSEVVFWPLPDVLLHATSVVNTENTVTRKVRRVGTKAELRDNEAMGRMWARVSGQIAPGQGLVDLR